MTRRLALLLLVAALSGAPAADAAFAPLPDKQFYSLRDEAANQTSDGPTSLATGDVNHDGFLDLVVPASETFFDPALGRLHVFLGDGSGRFAQSAGSPFGTTRNGSGISLADLSDDGHLDAVVAHNIQEADGVANGRVRLHLGDGLGGFAPGPQPSTNGDGSAAALVGHFGGGPRLDVAAVTARNVNSVVDGRVTVFEDSDGASLGPLTSMFLLGDPEPRFLASADMNGDGESDLIASNAGGTVNVLLQVGGPGFSQLAAQAGGPAPQTGIATGDFDGDGKADVAVASATSPGQVTLLRGDGAGGLAPFPGSPVETGGNSARGIAAADLNADGRVDLAVTNQQNPGQVAVLAGNGAGGFAPVSGSPFPTAIVELPAAVAVGDFDADGQPDLATAHSENAARMVVLINTDEPAARLGPGTLDFGERAVGVPAELTATLTNDGPGLLKPGPASVGGPDADSFAIASDGCGGVTLIVGASCTIGVRFGAQDLGARSATLSVPHNGSGGPRTIALAGRGRRPIVGRVKVAPARFAVGRKATPVSAARRGTSFRFTLSEAVRVTLRIERARRGRRGGRRWASTKIVLKRTGKAGANRVRFTGRTRRRRLRPGPHRVVVVARDSAGNASSKRTARFRIVRP